MTQALLQVIKLSWDYSLIPDDWMDSVVVSIPKKGDLSDTGNYRGIWLMCTALKILCNWVSGEINLSAEAHNRFSPCQAEFRRLEECITHAACFAEILQCRRHMDLDELRVLSVHITAWCRANEMEFGIHKCAIMEFEPNDSEGHMMEPVLPDAAMQAHMRLCGQPVPLVEIHLPWDRNHQVAQLH